MQQIPSGNELGEVASAPGEALVRENRGVCCVCFWASGLGEFLLLYIVLFTFNCHPTNMPD
jgi:hypothetical protein